MTRLLAGVGVLAALSMSPLSFAGSVQAHLQGPPPAVLMFSLPGCTHCVSAKAVLTRRHIPYQEVSLATDDGIKLAEQMKISPMAPIFVYRGKILKGYTEAKLLNLVEE